MYRSKGAIHGFIKRYIKRGTYENEKPTGRLNQISKDVEKEILDIMEGIVLLQRWLMQIQELNNIYPRTLDCILRGNGIRKLIASKGPKLLEGHSKVTIEESL